VPDEISISKTLSIRECGKDEIWLQDQIVANPKLLGLGDLVFVEREKRLSSGGRLDILLKSRDGEAVFEVEVMLGETDGSHINRTIEYWDLEESQDPQRNHFPVLVAEKVTRRFFNVIFRLSRSIPIIAIQANLVEVDGKIALHFMPVLNAFESAKAEGRKQFESKAENEFAGAFSEEEWLKKSPITVACAKAFFAAVRRALPSAKLKFSYKFGVGIYVGSRCYFWFKHQDGDKSEFNFYVDERGINQAKELLEQAGFSASTEDGYFWKLVDARTIEAHANLFQQLGPIVDASRRSNKLGGS
jgi:hypothetical protein